METHLPPCDALPFLRARVGDEPWCVGGDDGFGAFVVSPDGRHLAGASYAGAWILRTDDGRVTRCVARDVGCTRAMFFSPDGASLYALGSEGFVVFRVHDGTISRRLQRPGTLSHAAALSPDGALLLLHGREQVLLDARDGAELLHAPPGREGAWWRAMPVFTRDGRFAVTVGEEILRWDLAARTITSVGAGNDFTASASFGAHDVMLAGHEAVSRLDVATGQYVARGTVQSAVSVVSRGDAVWFLAVDPLERRGSRLIPYDPTTLAPRSDTLYLRMQGNDRVATHGERFWVRAEGVVHAIDPAAQTHAWRPKGSRARCREIAFDADARHLSAAFGDAQHGGAWRWNIASGAITGRLEASFPMRISPDGHIAIGGDRVDGDAFVRTRLDKAAEPEHLTSRIAGDAVAPGVGDACLVSRQRSVEVLPSGREYAVKDGRVFRDFPVWDEAAKVMVVAGGKQLQGFDLVSFTRRPPLTVGVVKCWCVRDGAAWVAGETLLTRWNLATSERTARLALPLDRGEAPTALAVAPDNDLVALGSDKGRVALFKCSEPSRVARFEAVGGDAVTACAFSGDGALLATGGHDALVRVWDVADAFEAATAPRPANARPTRR